MLRIIYVSTATQCMEIKDLEFMLEKISEKNVAKQITGILLYANKTFIEVIEGDCRTVKELYQQILKNSRHKNCILLQEVEIKTLSFSIWSMGFPHTNNIDITKMKYFNNFLFTDYEENHTISNEPLIMEVLNYFKNRISTRLG